MMMMMMDLRKGDCLEVMKGIETGSIDAIITDPPYGTTACKWDSVIDFDLMWEQLNRIIKPNGAIVLFGSEPFSSALRMSNIKNYKYDWIWDKVQPSGAPLVKRMPMKQHEIISVFYSKQCLYNRQMTDRPKKDIRVNAIRNKNNQKTKYSQDHLGKIKNKYADDYDPTKVNPKSIIRYSKQPKRIKFLHPTQKPIALMEYLIKTYTNENETVLDFTMGSGSTGVACKNTNRNFIGIEQDDKYFNIASERINNG
jgi:site-specific DNA-methyltransferase (adenine-specific)